MHHIFNNRTRSKISELFFRSDVIHSPDFLQQVIFMSRDLDSISYCYLLSRSGVRIWNKIPLTLREQRKDPFKRKLRKLLIKVLKTKNVYVDMSTITSSYLNSLFS